MDLPTRTIPFPTERDIVYVVGFQRDAEFVPIYVGESTRNIGRFGDYVSGQFSAQTDFKVGIAVKHLNKLGFQVVIRYDETKNRKDDERRILAELRKKYRLLNDLKGYAYRTAQESEERERVECFVTTLV